MNFFPHFLIGSNVNFFLFIPKVYDILYWKKGFIFEKLDNNNNDINGNKNINKISDKEIKSDMPLKKKIKFNLKEKMKIIMRKIIKVIII